MMAFLETSKWIWIDYAIAGVLAISAVLGLFRGFVKEVVMLATWLAAIGVSVAYSHDFSALLQDKIAHPAARIAVAFALLFFFTLIVGGIIRFILSQLLQKAGITFGDRLLGMGFGLIRGAVTVALLVMLAGLTPLPKDAWWRQSQLLPPFEALAVWLKDFIPSNLAGYINYR